MLHDIGKIGVKEDILNKKGSLEDHEYKEIQKHPLIGYNILKDLEFTDRIKRLCFSTMKGWMAEVIRLD